MVEAIRNRGWDRLSARDAVDKPGFGSVRADDQFRLEQRLDRARAAEPAGHPVGGRRALRGRNRRVDERHVARVAAVAKPRDPVQLKARLRLCCDLVADTLDVVPELGDIGPQPWRFGAGEDVDIVHLLGSIGWRQQREQHRVAGRTPPDRAVAQVDVHAAPVLTSGLVRLDFDASRPSPLADRLHVARHRVLGRKHQAFGIAARREDQLRLGVGQREKLVAGRDHTE